MRTSGFTISENNCTWVRGNTQRPSIELQFGVGDGPGATCFVDTGEWAITRLPNIAWSWSYRRRGKEPAIEQRHKLVGEGVVSNDGAIAYLGPYHDYTETAPTTGEEFRLVVPRDASLRDDPARILNALTHASRFLNIGALNDSVLAIAAPTDAQNWAAKGTQRGDEGFWVRDDAVTDEVNETWVHEYVHTRQRFERTSDSYWFQEGTADYFAALAAFKRGDVEFDEFHRFLTTTRDERAVLSDASTWRSNSTAYRRGRRACAALDLLIRDDSGGSNTLMDVLVELNRQVGQSESGLEFDTTSIREVVDTVVDGRTSTWFQRYIYDRQIPRISNNPSEFLAKPPRSTVGIEPEPEPEPSPEPRPERTPEPEQTHRCPICDKTTTDDLCPICGHEFEPDSSDSESDPNECPICERLTTEQYCPICGHEFDITTTSDSTPTPGGDYPTSPGSNTCPICDTSFDERLCPTCGHEMGQSGSGGGNRPERKTSSCPVCYTITTDQLCPTCGHELMR